MKVKLRSRGQAPGIMLLIASLSSGQQTVGPLHLVTQKPHPLDEIFLALATEYGWPLTYEEAPVFAADELTTSISPTGRVNLVKRGIPLSIDLTPTELAATGNGRLGVIRSILDAYTQTRTAESFGTIESQGFIHVVPFTVRGVNGKAQAFEPILNTRISFPEQHFPTIYNFLDQVLSQVSQKRTTSIVLGTTPTNVFRQNWVFAGASDEPARDVLSRVFRDVTSVHRSTQPPVDLCWGMLYDPTNRQYWFNVSVVSGGTPTAEPSQEQPGTPSPQNAVNPNRRPNAVHKSN